MPSRTRAGGTATNASLLLKVLGTCCTFICVPSLIQAVCSQYFPYSHILPPVTWIHIRPRGLTQTHCLQYTSLEFIPQPFSPSCSGNCRTHSSSAIKQRAYHHFLTSLIYLEQNNCKYWCKVKTVMGWNCQTQAKEPKPLPLHSSGSPSISPSAQQCCHLPLKSAER